MKKMASLALLGVALSLCTKAQATLITFEDLAGRGTIPLPENYGGLKWSPNFGVYDWPQSAYNPHSGIVRMFATREYAAENFIDFPTPVIVNGAWFGGSNSLVDFSLYNAGSLVHRSDNIRISDTPTFLAAGYTGLVDRIIINGQNGRFVMDDLQFNGSTVPEPSSLLLTGLGIFAFAVTHRRRPSSP